ncbi:MAG: HD-GYP domain-containing protein, partial [Phocaeicola sp.]|nr:HD-GYP domain-containing protein [Phocaeicola sp.]
LKNILDTIFNSYSVEEITVRANKNTQIIFKKDYKLLAEITIPMIILIGILSWLLKRAIYNKKKAEKLGNTLLETMAKVNQLKETESGIHAKRVELHAEFLAKKMGLSQDFILKLKRGAILHDIGKVIVPGDILNKKGKLTTEEFEIMKKHPEFGYELACKLELGDVEKNVIRFHHEKWSGKGYPVGLKGEAIPLEGRLLGIIDAYDSMREDKIYKKGLSHEEAIEIIKADMGIGFDPNITKIFLENEEKFNEIFNNTKEDIDLVSEYYNIMKNH